MWNTKSIPLHNSVKMFSVSSWYTVTKVIDFPRYNTKCSEENETVRGIFHEVSLFPLNFVLYRGNLEYFLDSVWPRMFYPLYSCAQYNISIYWLCNVLLFPRAVIVIVIFNFFRNDSRKITHFLHLTWYNVIRRQFNTYTHVLFRAPKSVW